MGRGDLLDRNSQSTGIRNLSCGYLVWPMHFCPILSVGIFLAVVLGMLLSKQPHGPDQGNPMLKDHFSSLPDSSLSWLLLVVETGVVVPPFHTQGIDVL